MKKTILTLFCVAMATFASAQTKSTFVHMKSGEIKEIPYSEIDSITFGNHVDYDKEIKAEYTKNIYYGSGQYMIHLSDAPISDSGLPTQVGQTVLRFVAFNVEDPDGKNAQLPSGTYSSDLESFSQWSLYNNESYLCVMVCTGIVDGEVDGYSVPLTSAKARIKNNNGNYYIEFTGDTGEKYDNVDFQTIRVTYSGELPFDNQDPKSYNQLTDDVTMVPTGISGRYTSSDNYGNYSIALYNCPLDSDGYIVGEGELMNFELLTQPGTPMDINNIVGEYTVASVTEGPYEPGKVLSGTLYEYYGMYIPMGTYYTSYGSDGSSTNTYGFVTGGTAKLSTDGTNVTFDCDFEVEGGKKLTIKYTGPVSGISDYTSSASYVKSKQRSGISPLRAAGVANVFKNMPALKLVRK